MELRPSDRKMATELVPYSFLNSEPFPAETAAEKATGVAGEHPGGLVDCQPKVAASQVEHWGKANSERRHCWLGTFAESMAVLLVPPVVNAAASAGGSRLLRSRYSPACFVRAPWQCDCPDSFVVELVLMECYLEKQMTD